MIAVRNEEKHCREVHESELAEHTSVLIHKAPGMAKGIHQEGPVLHSDNGSPMNEATIGNIRNRDTTGEV